MVGGIETIRFAALAIRSRDSAQEIDSRGFAASGPAQWFTGRSRPPHHPAQQAQAEQAGGGEKKAHITTLSTHPCVHFSKVSATLQASHCAAARRGKVRARARAGMENFIVAQKCGEDISHDLRQLQLVPCLGIVPASACLIFLRLYQRTMVCPCGLLGPIPSKTAFVSSAPAYPLCLVIVPFVHQSWRDLAFNTICCAISCSGTGEPSPYHQSSCSQARQGPIRAYC